MLRPSASQLSKKQKSTASNLSKKPRSPVPAPSRKPKPPALQPSGMPRPRGSPRLSNSACNMPKPSETWRNKSSERKAEAKPTFSLPVRQPYMPAQWTAKACWWLPITFWWGRHPCPTCSPYHKEPLQQNNCLPQQLLKNQHLSSPPGPKGNILPQTLQTTHLLVQPYLRQTQKGPLAPKSKRSHLGTRFSSRAVQKCSAGTLTWWRRLGRNTSKSIPTTSLQRAPMTCQRSSGGWLRALSY